MGTIRGEPDEALQQLLEALREYEAAHPKSKVVAYRENEVSVRIRIIDPDFKGKNLVERDDEVWRIIERLPEETLRDVTLLLLLTPGEARTSFVNREFEKPTPYPPDLFDPPAKARRNGRRNAGR